METHRIGSRRRPARHHHEADAPGGRSRRRWRTRGRDARGLHAGGRHGRLDVPPGQVRGSRRCRDRRSTPSPCALRPPRRQSPSDSGHVARPRRRPAPRARTTTPTPRPSSSASSMARARRRAPATSRWSPGSRAASRSSTSRSTRSSTRSTRRQPLDALGFNGTWPGPRLEVIEGDQVRAIFNNRMPSPPASTSTASACPTRWTASRTSRRTRSSRATVHLRVPRPSRPARTCTTRTTTRRTRSGAASSGRSSSSRGTRPSATTAVRRDPGHRLDQQRRAGRLHDQRPRLPGDLADRRQARRDDRDPVHERGA